MWSVLMEWQMAPAASSQFLATGHSYDMPGTEYVTYANSAFTTTWGGNYNCPHFANRETEA